MDHRLVNFVQQGDGAPVILVHGLAASLHDWDALLPDLAAAGYAGYALDLLGHGESAKPASLENYHIEGVFEHLHAWLESLALDQPVVFIGHSLGGYLGMQYALRFPARVHALVLANPFYSLEQLPVSLQVVFQRPLVNTALIEHTPYWLFRLLIDASSLRIGNSGGQGHSLPEQIRIQTALDYKRAASGIYNIPRTLHDLTPDLARLALPALVIWGAHDQTLDPHTFARLVESLPEARGVEIPVCGHVAHQCHPAEFNRLVLEFLGELGSPPGQ
ncbi:MAG: alpha/beta hydrolase [Chloroflexota bacterium]